MAKETAGVTQAWRRPLPGLDSSRGCRLDSQSSSSGHGAWTVSPGKRGRRCHPRASPPCAPSPLGAGTRPARRPGLFGLYPTPPGTSNLSPLALLADLGLSLASAWAPGLFLEPGQAPPSTRPRPQSHPAGRELTGQPGTRAGEAPSGQRGLGGWGPPGKTGVALKG